ncbi:MAG: hypothetical protein AMXMBFR34_40050 [Myxococcaceae bacterium]
MTRLLTFALAAALAACTSPEGSGLMKTSEGTGAEVRFDVYHRPLPEIPLPNDFATRFDATSPTKRRVNASMLAATKWERATREVLDQLDGWGTYQTITVGFSKPLDVQNLIARHQGDDYFAGDDAAYLIDITPDSPDFCQRVPLDLGEGNFPLTLERPSYFSNDRDGEQLVFEDREEDLNRNNVLDPGEDLDMDGVLDHPNTLHPGQSKFDVLEFYERETNTLLLKPVLPLRENTRYAVVLTKRLTDEDGRPVRSPFAYINHTSQTEVLKPLDRCLPRYGLGLQDVAFTWAYSTMSVSRDLVAIRDGLYGLGAMQRLATEFPAEVKELLTLKDAMGPGVTVNVRLVPGEEFRQAAIDLLKSMGGGDLSPTYQAVIDSHKFIDFHVVFSFESPQFFRRADSEGKMLPLYRQVFEVDPITGAAFTRPEKIFVWLTVPKNRRGPAPVVVLGHGYTGNKLDPLFYGGYFARYGMAAIGMENVSHGIGLPKEDLELGRALLASKGLGNMFDALVKNDRAIDWNADGIKDSAADFWTAYILHTRDVVRQTSIDYMQLVRVLRGFDGLKTWRYDGNKDGKEDLAGDFNGDGVIDVGGTAAINITGGSLGGIMSAMMSGLEPQLDVAVPVSGGAGLPDIGVRSIQGGVREAVNLRMLGPLLVTLKDSATGTLELWTELPDLNDLGRRKLATVDQPLNEGDTAVLFNLTSGEHRCFRVGAGGLLRAAISSDEGDDYKLSVYAGALPPKERDGCSVPDDAVPYWTADKTGFAFKWQGVDHAAGEQLKALGDGFGLRRQSPEIRRFMGLAQLAIEQGDPVNYVPFSEKRRILRFGTGEEVATRMMVCNTIGDMNVPVATGTAIARAAGTIELFEKDPRYGKTENRVLIDTGTIDAVERNGPWKDSMGRDVHMDIEVLSALSGSDDGFDVPRLNPPLRLVKDSERIGGKVGVLFPMVVPTGRHGFDPPDPSLSFDLGSVMMNMLGRYMQTGGMELPMEACMEDNSCSWIPPIPVD